jgi:hypothetical protein
VYLDDFLADPQLVEAGFLEAVVWEPDYSRGRLLELQARYGLDTMEVYDEYRRAEQFLGGQRGGILAFIDEADLAEWVHYYEIFRASGGDPWELHGDPEPRWPEGEGSLPCGGATAAFLLGSELPAASLTPAPPGHGDGGGQGVGPPLLSGLAGISSSRTRQTEKGLRRLAREVGAVLHFAALSLVGESVSNPALYYENNVQKGLAFLHIIPSRN